MSGFPIVEPDNGDGSKRQNEVEDRVSTGHGDDHKQNEVGDRAPMGHEDDRNQTEVGDSAPTHNEQGTDLHVLVKNGRRYITCVCNGSKKCQFCDGVVVPPTNASSCKLNQDLASELGAIAMRRLGLLVEEPANIVDAVVTVTGKYDRLNALLRLLSPLIVHPICSYLRDKGDKRDEWGKGDEHCGVCEECICQEEWTGNFRFDHSESVCGRNRFHLRYGNSRCVLEIVSPVSFTGVMQGVVNGELCRYQSIFTRPPQQTFLRMERSTLPATPAKFLPTDNPQGMLDQFRRLECYFELTIRHSTRTGNALTRDWVTPFVGGTLARRAVQREFREMFASTAGLGEFPMVLLDSIMSYLCPVSQIEVRSECDQCRSRNASEISFVFSCCGAHFCMECVARRLRKCIMEPYATYTLDDYAHILENVGCSEHCEPDEACTYAPCRSRNYLCGHEHCISLRNQEEERRKTMREERDSRWFDENDREFDEN